MFISFNSFQPSVPGSFDLILFALIIWWDIRIVFRYRFKALPWRVILLKLLLMGFVLPFMAIIVEWKLVSLRHEFLDGHEGLYAFLRFPVFWAFGFMETVVLSGFWFRLFSLDNK